jgi:phosphatidate cytidylyltransferase
VAFVVTIAAGLAGPYALIPLYLYLAIFGVLEYASMLRLRGVGVHRDGLLAMVILLVPASLPDNDPLGLTTAWFSYPDRSQLTLAFVIMMMVISLGRRIRDPFPTIVYSLLGYLWIPTFLSFMLTLRSSPDTAAGLVNVLLPALAVIASDVGAFLAGKFAGRTPFMRHLSPSKTIEGAAGGLLLAAIALPLSHSVFTAFSLPSPEPAVLLAFGLIVAAFSQAGDLFESLIKRWAGVKDTGLFLPGQGGVLDRIDSHLIGLPVGFFLLSLMGRL